MEDWKTGRLEEGKKGRREEEGNRMDRMRRMEWVKAEGVGVEPRAVAVNAFVSPSVPPCFSASSLLWCSGALRETLPLLLSSHASE
jgi:hypothetical protein